jgi:hypothetical protein
MAGAGVILMIVLSKISETKNQGHTAAISKIHVKKSVLPISIWIRQGIFIMIVVFSLVVRSAWTPEVLQHNRAKHIHCIDSGNEINVQLINENKKEYQNKRSRHFPIILL